MIVQHFCNAISPNLRSAIDAAARGDLIGKTEGEAYAFLDKIAYNNYQWNSERANVKCEVKKPARIFEIDAMPMINAKFDSLARRMDKITMGMEAKKSSSSSKTQGKPPSQPENPRECKVVHLRSGKVVGDESEKKKKKKDKLSEKKERVVEKQGIKRKQEVEKEEEERYIPPKPYKSPLPFPQRFQKAKLDKQFDKCLEVLKKLYVNIPFIDALSQMPLYAKFLKDILSNKRRLEEYETMALMEECSALLQNKLSPKLKDPRSFSIPCQISETDIGKSLCDLGASLKIGDLMPTTISLQLADRSIKYPIGILENMPLKVDKFFISIDFLVLKMEKDINISIILERPFLATVEAIINVKNRRLKLK
ncbi:hypothetical protein MANES_15G176096v8, partial [Manihot esculenta]